MKKLGFLLSFLLISCEVNETEVQFEEGDYSGTFTLVESNGQVLTGKVDFSLNNNKYSVIPEQRYLPPAGAGTYSINGNTINLIDTAGHRADFDFTLILNGDFEFLYNERVLTLKQNDTMHDRERTILLNKLK
jgi:hypothetical protein